jgi:hypothetical protein
MMMGKGETGMRHKMHHKMMHHEMHKMHHKKTMMKKDKM